MKLIVYVIILIILKKARRDKKSTILLNIIIDSLSKYDHNEDFRFFRDSIHYLALG